MLNALDLAASGTLVAPILQRTRPVSPGAKPQLSNWRSSPSPFCIRLPANHGAVPRRSLVGRGDHAPSAGTAVPLQPHRGRSLLVRLQDPEPAGRVTSGRQDE